MVCFKLWGQLPAVLSPFFILVRTYSIRFRTNAEASAQSLKISPHRVREPSKKKKVTYLKSGLDRSWRAFYLVNADAVFTGVGGERAIFFCSLGSGVSLCEMNVGKMILVFLLAFKFQELGECTISHPRGVWLPGLES